MHYLLPFAALLFTTGTPSQEAAPAYRAVTFKELVQELKSHKGKVVLVDLWTDG